MTNLDSVEKQRHYSVNKGLYRQGYGLLSGHVQLFKSWTIKKAGTKELMPLNCDAGEDS